MHLFEICVNKIVNAELISAQRMDRNSKKLEEFLVLVEGNKVGASRNQGDETAKTGSI